MCCRLHSKRLLLSPGFATCLALGALIHAGVRLRQEGIESVILIFGITLILLFCVRMLSRTKPVHDLQGLLLSFLLLISGTVLHTQMSYAVVFVVYVFAGVWALSTWQLLYGNAFPPVPDLQDSPNFHRTDVMGRNYALSISAMGFGVLGFTVLLFVSFPRIGLGQLSFLGRDANQLPTAVRLTHAPRLQTSGNNVVARIENIPFNIFEQGLYLRAQVYDAITENGFESTDRVPQATVPRNRWSRSLTEHDYEIFMQPVTSEELATLGPAVQAHIVSGGNGNPAASHLRIRGIGPSGEVFPSDSLRGSVRYRVTGPVMLPFPSLQNRIFSGKKVKAERQNVLAYFLQLPEGVPSEILKLANRLVGDSKSSAEKANVLRNHLYQNYAYSLNPPKKDEQGQIYSFLFNERQGHCEYFAATFALMLRATGVPARVVGGYQGGFWDNAEELAVFTGKNAHVWVEWYHPKIGWVIDDATPVMYRQAERLEGWLAVRERLRLYWDDYVVEYALGNQLSLLGAAWGQKDTLTETWTELKSGTPSWGGALLFPLALFLVLVGLLYAKRRQPSLNRIVRVFDKIFGLLLPNEDLSTLTYREALALVRRADVSLAADTMTRLHGAAGDYERARFSGSKVDEQDWLQLEKNAKLIYRSIKKGR